MTALGRKQTLKILNIISYIKQSMDISAQPRQNKLD